MRKMRSTGTLRRPGRSSSCRRCRPGRPSSCHWTPTPEQNAELMLIEDLLIARTARSNELFLQWRQDRLDENARRKALNEVAKTGIDMEVKDLKERGETINKLWDRY